MSKRFLIALGVLVGVVAIVGLTTGPAVQAQGESPYMVSQTPWGDPDFQSSWENRTPTPLERPVEYGTREFLTEEEAAQRTQTRGGLPDGEEGIIADDLAAADVTRVERSPGPEDFRSGVQRVLERSGERASDVLAHIADRQSLERSDPGLHPSGAREVGRPGNRQSLSR